MGWSKYLLILCLTANFHSFESRILTEKENEDRLKICGSKRLKSKVFNGREANVGEAPWAVQVISPNSSCTGTLISSRHVITATHCIAENDKKQWNSNNLNYKFDRSKCEKHNNVVIRETLASKVAVMSNKTIIGRAKYLVLIGFCRIANERYHFEYADDLMIVELSEDVEYSPLLQPACVARDTKDNEEGSILEFYGFGQNPGKTEKEAPQTHGVLRHEQTKILNENKKGTSKRIDPRVFHTRSVTEMSVGCQGDSGGGAIGKVDGRDTVVGVMMQSSCETMKREKEALEAFASVGFHANHICRYTGICSPPRGTSERISLVISIFSVIFSLVYL